MEKPMKFYSLPYKSPPPSDADYPTIVFCKDNWDDYGYKTLYKVFYYTSMCELSEMGYVKIMNNDNKITTIPHDFTALSEDYCALGSIEYYQKLREQFGDGAINVLERLKDCAMSDDIRDKFSKKVGFQKSLLRESDSEKALYEAKDIIAGKSPIFNSRFSFKCDIEGFDGEHSIDFNFQPIGDDVNIRELPYRIFCIIGKNGTGKTQFLSKLALGMSGQVAGLHGNFSPGRPLFSKVIAVSYSMFDAFEKPVSDKRLVRQPGWLPHKSRKTLRILLFSAEVVRKLKFPNNSKVFSYVYCGLRDPTGAILSDEKIYDNFNKSLNKIKESGDEKTWIELLRSSFSETQLDLDNVDGTLKNFSSGQAIILNCITHLLANMTKDTLVIYDEPEMHLHPNGVSHLIKMLYDLLKRKESYAILATHSPIIIQQIPSEYVRIISKIDNAPSMRKPFLETFGENLSAITNDIFGNNNEKEYYKQVLEGIGCDSRYLEENIFKGKLSLNARIFLEGRYKHEIN